MGLHGVDAGHTWRNIGLEDSYHIGAVRVHPKNADIVYVAALGHLWGPNEMRGVYRTTDGGATWKQVLKRSNNAGAVDIAMDPNNPIPHHLLGQTYREMGMTEEAERELKLSEQLRVQQEAKP